MAHTLTFQIVGGAALEHTLRELDRIVSKKVINQALRPAAKVIQTLAKRLVPVQTGTLRASLKVRALPRSRRSFGVAVVTGAVAGGTKTRGRMLKGDLDLPPYGGWVEFGHLIGKRNRRKSVKQDLRHVERGGLDRVAAHPYQRDAMEEGRETVINVLSANVAIGVEREFRALMAQRAFDRSILAA